MLSLHLPCCWRCLATVLILLATHHSLARASDDVAAEFDRQIAPLLGSRCLGCHNSTDKKGGLDLSRRSSALAGGESGSALAPGDPAASLLWQRIEAGEMPPDERLSAGEKERLKSWIADGADWGTEPIDPFQFSSATRAGYDWWSLQPVSKPELPKHHDRAWPHNGIDHFVLARLRAAGLSPAPEAQPRTLVRRLYFDLIGLPPTPDEMDHWVSRLAVDAEQREAAYRELVDHLLDSPHYGERWARHWLDVIRFGESQGFERNRIRENAWRYRDWVIAAFNDDLPYDEFIRQQIAGDVLYPDDLDAILATGYLVSGTWDQVGHNEGSAEMRKAVRQEDLEDMVAAVGQSILGLSINCARCHDHKFDPISQAEYYQVAALLGGVTQQEKERQGITAKPASDVYRQWKISREAKRRECSEAERALRNKYGSEGGAGIPHLQVLYIPSDTRAPTIPDRSGVQPSLDLARRGTLPYSSDQPASRLIDSVQQTNELTVEVWLTPDKSDQKGPARIVTLSPDTRQRNFTLGQEGSRFDVRLRTTKTDDQGLPSLTSPEEQAAERRMHVIFTFDRTGRWVLYVDGRQVAEKTTGGDLSNWNDGFRLSLGNELTGDRPWQGQLHLVAIYSVALSAEQVRRHFDTDSGDVRAGETVAQLLEKASPLEKSRWAELQRELQQLDDAEPAPPFDGVAHVVIPQQPPVYHVLARGDYRNPREVVKPAGLKALSRGGLSADFGLAADAPEAERRVALARWLSDARNPLTARVLVNRLWHYHFGRGIVDTPSDFGFAGAQPTHPELLDWLAATFVDGGWRIKHLQRVIVTSATYRQASNVTNPLARQTDAENQLLWRANSRKLEAEAVRDAMLAVSGALQRNPGGPSYRDMVVKLSTNHEFTDPTGEFSDEVNRRTIYRLWARCGNNPFLESLDCADPSVMLPRRTQTITPVQSLSLLNNSLVEQCATLLAARARTDAGENPAAQIRHAYRLTLNRTPLPRELDLAKAFVAKHGLVQMCVVLLNTNEFLFVE